MHEVDYYILTLFQWFLALSQHPLSNKQLKLIVANDCSLACYVITSISAYYNCYEENYNM